MLQKRQVRHREVMLQCCEAKSNYHASSNFTAFSTGPPAGASALGVLRKQLFRATARAPECDSLRTPSVGVYRRTPPQVPAWPFLRHLLKRHFELTCGKSVAATSPTPVNHRCSSPRCSVSCSLVAWHGGLPPLGSLHLPPRPCFWSL